MKTDLHRVLNNVKTLLAKYPRLLEEDASNTEVVLQYWEHYHGRKLINPSTFDAETNRETATRITSPEAITRALRRLHPERTAAREAMEVDGEQEYKEAFANASN